MSEETAVKTRVVPPSIWHGIAAALTVGSTIAWASARETDALPNPAALIASVVLGLLVTLCAALRLRALLVGLGIGLATGVVSSAQVLVQDVADPLLPVVASLGFFLALGFVLGGMIEFIFFLHHLSHGGTPSEYPKK